MTAAKNKIITVQNISITITTNRDEDYICITDMVRAREDSARAADVIKNWIRNRSTLEFLGTWESLYNPNFKVVEFDHFKKAAGLPTFTLSVNSWVEKTNAIGIYSKSGKYGGTYAHKDIAFEFGTAINPVFKLYLIKEFQKLKEQESAALKSPEWLHRRFLSKANYRIQTDAIKQHLLPKLNLPKERESFVYAREAEILNLAVFGMTSRDWAQANPENAMKGENIRDDASMSELIALSNAEVLNKELITQNVPEEKRLEILRKSAIETISSLEASPTIRNLNMISD